MVTERIPKWNRIIKVCFRVDTANRHNLFWYVKLIKKTITKCINVSRAFALYSILNVHYTKKNSSEIYQSYQNVMSRDKIYRQITCHNHKTKAIFFCNHRFKRMLYQENTLDDALKNDKNIDDFQ